MLELQNRHPSLDEALMMVLVEVARQEAAKKHGPLQGGMDRWIHHLQEECEEAVLEMRTLKLLQEDGSDGKNPEVKMRLLAELAQVAQLAETMIEMILGHREREGEETWQAPK